MFGVYSKHSKILEQSTFYHIMKDCRRLVRICGLGSPLPISLILPAFVLASSGLHDYAQSEHV